MSSSGLGEAAARRHARGLEARSEMEPNLRFTFRPCSKWMLAKASVATLVICLLAPASIAQAAQYDQETREIESTVAAIQEALSAGGQDGIRVVKPELSGVDAVTASVQDATT